MNDEVRRGPGRPPRSPADRVAMDGDRAPRSSANPYGISRENRRNVGAPDYKLQAASDPTKYRRFVNDTNNRVESLIQQGYTFVKASSASAEWTGDPRKDRESAECRTVGTNEDGSPMRAYLMEMPIDWRREDISRRDEALKEKERPIYERPTTEGPTRRRVDAPSAADAHDGNAFYRPSEGSHMRYETASPDNG